MLKLYLKFWTFRTIYAHKRYAYKRMSVFELNDKLAFQAESEKDF